MLSRDSTLSGFGAQVLAAAATSRRKGVLTSTSMKNNGDRLDFYIDEDIGTALEPTSKKNSGVCLALVTKRESQKEAGSIICSVVEGANATLGHISDHGIDVDTGDCG